MSPAQRIYETPAEQAREGQRRYRARLWAEFLSVYGHECACCGEAEEQFLTISHTFGDGAAARKRVSGSVRDRASTLRDLKQRGWPRDEGIAVECFNCNLGARLGACPHGTA